MNIEVKPDLTIVTSVYNALEHTHHYTENIPATLPPSLKVEFILVNDGSDLDTTIFLRDLPEPWIVRNNADNQGFAWRNNEGAKTARGKYILFLNNDVVAQPGWLEPMLDVMMNPPSGHKVGCVGNIQNYAGKPTINHAGIYFHPGDFTMRHAWDGWPKPPKPKVWDWHAVTAACMLVERDLFIQAGSFDEQFKNGYEDADFCLRLFKDGYSNLVANQSRVGHWVSSSPGRFNREDQNFLYFQEKWGSWLHVLARRDFARIYFRSQTLGHALKDWRSFAYAMGCKLQPERPFDVEPTMAWQTLAHQGKTLDALHRKPEK